MFSPGTPISSTSKTGRHDIAEILLKVALNTINLKSKSLQILENNYRPLSISHHISTYALWFSLKFSVSLVFQLP